MAGSQVIEAMYLTHATQHFGLDANPSHKARAASYALEMPVATYGVKAKEPNHLSKSEDLVQRKWDDFLTAVLPFMGGNKGKNLLMVLDLNAAYQECNDSEWKDGRKIEIPTGIGLANLAGEVAEYFKGFGESKDILGRMDAAVRMGVVDFYHQASVEKTGIARASVKFPGNPFSDRAIAKSYLSTLEDRQGLPFYIPVAIDFPSALAFLHENNLLGGEHPRHLVKFPQQFIEFLICNRQAVREDTERLVQEGRLNKHTLDVLGYHLAYGLQTFADNAPIALMRGLYNAVTTPNLVEGRRIMLGDIPMTQ